MKKFNLNTIIIRSKEILLTPEGDSTFPIKAWPTVVLALGITAFLIQFHGAKKKAPPRSDTIQSIDTLIPKGESLVPIKVSNYESLDQVIGQYGVVDLLSTPLNPHEKARRIAYAVKLIRSPKSPRHFSVLIPADEAHKLAGFHGEFTVIVRNPKLLGTKIVKKRGRPAKRRVLFETESL